MSFHSQHNELLVNYLLVKEVRWIWPLLFPFDLKNNQVQDKKMLSDRIKIQNFVPHQIMGQFCFMDRLLKKDKIIFTSLSPLPLLLPLPY